MKGELLTMKMMMMGLVFLVGPDEGEVVVGEDDDDGWEPINLVTGPCDSDSEYWQNLAHNSD